MMKDFSSCFLMKLRRTFGALFVDVSWYIALTHYAGLFRTFGALLHISSCCLLMEHWFGDWKDGIEGGRKKRTIGARAVFHAEATNRKRNHARLHLIPAAPCITNHEKNTWRRKQHSFKKTNLHENESNANAFLKDTLKPTYECKKVRLR